MGLLLCLTTAACAGSDGEPGSTEEGAAAGSGSTGSNTGSSTLVDPGSSNTGAAGSASANNNSGGAVVNNAGGTGSDAASTGGANNAGGTADPEATDGVGSSNGGNGNGSSNEGSGGGGACAAGSAVQGDGPDMCPSLSWQCVDETVGNPPVELSGAECSAGHTGGCCNYNDKCLTNTDGSPGSVSAVETALGPCQAGCIANPSAQACLDCVNANLMNAGLPALSAECGVCWTDLISCSFTSCLTPCLAGADAPACRQCAFSNCVVGAGKFNECSGLLSRGGL